MSPLVYQWTHISYVNPTILDLYRLILCKQSTPDHYRIVPQAPYCEAVVREDMVIQFDEGIRRTRKMGLLAVANFNDHPPVIRYPVDARGSS